MRLHLKARYDSENKPKSVTKEKKSMISGKELFTNISLKVKTHVSTRIRENLRMSSLK